MTCCHKLNGAGGYIGVVVVVVVVIATRSESPRTSGELARPPSFRSVQWQFDSRSGLSEGCSEFDLFTNTNTVLEGERVITFYLADTVVTAQIKKADFVYVFFRLIGT